jgi:hypothetical protein
MNDENDGYEPITYKGVQRRLDIVIEAVGVELKLKSTLYPENLLTNVREDLVEIRAAIDYLE